VPDEVKTTQTAPKTGETNTKAPDAAKDQEEANAAAAKADEERRAQAAAEEKAVAEEKARITAEQEKVRKADAEKIAALRGEPDGNLSKEQEAALDEMFGDDSEDVAEFNRDAPDDLKDAIRVLHKLAASIPDSTPDSHTVWGAAGVVLNVGHIRTLVKHSPMIA
jgi:hypothetical protein